MQCSMPDTFSSSNRCGTLTHSLTLTDSVTELSPKGGGLYLDSKYLFRADGRRAGTQRGIVQCQCCRPVPAAAFVMCLPAHVMSALPMGLESVCTNLRPLLLVNLAKAMTGIEKYPRIQGLSFRGVAGVLTACILKDCAVVTLT